MEKQTKPYDNQDLHRAYTDLQRRYDDLEADIYHVHEQKIAELFEEASVTRRKLDEAKDTIDKLRQRLEHYKKRHDRHLEERVKNREIIENLRKRLDP